MGKEDLLNEMDSMIESLTGYSTRTPVTDSISTDAPGTDSPNTEIPTTEIPDEVFETDSPTTDEPGTESPVTNAPDEIALLKDEIEKLKSENKKGNVPKTPTPATYAPISEEDFIGDVDLDDLTRDPKAFNQLLNSIYTKAINRAREEVKNGSEDILKSIPDIVKNNITLVSNLKRASEEFYNENEDLVPFKRVVATVFEEIAAENPDRSYLDNLKKVGIEVRERLGLKKQALNNEKRNSRNSPKLPRNKKGVRQRPKPELRGLVSELDAMDKALNN